MATTTIFEKSFGTLQAFKITKENSIYTFWSKKLRDPWLRIKDHKLSEGAISGDKKVTQALKDTKAFKLFIKLYDEEN